MARKIAFWFVLLIVGFLTGFILQYSRLQQARQQLSASTINSTHAAVFRLDLRPRGLDECSGLQCLSSPRRKLISPPSRMAKPDK